MEKQKVSVTVPLPMFSAATVRQGKSSKINISSSFARKRKSDHFHIRKRAQHKGALSVGLETLAHFQFSPITGPRSCDSNQIFFKL